MQSWREHYCYQSGPEKTRESWGGVGGGSKNEREGEEKSHWQNELDLIIETDQADVAHST